MKKEDIQRVADFMNSINPLIAMGIMKIKLFEQALKEMEDAHSTHQAIGFIASGYEIKQKEYKFRIERMKAVVNLLKVYLESQNDIVEIESMKENHQKIEDMFGL